MNNEVSRSRWTVVGAGLAGTCLALELNRRGEDFRWLDSSRVAGASRVAAGLLNPITGRNFEPSWRISEFHPAALALYEEIGGSCGREFWHPLPMRRFIGSSREAERISRKLQEPAVARWLAEPCPSAASAGGAIELSGAGWLDVPGFLDASRDRLAAAGILLERRELALGDSDARTIWCEGWQGLIGGRYGPQRCAKGEILTLQPDCEISHEIRVGSGGWAIPLGNGQWRVGSTYEWDQLDSLPTPEGQRRVLEIAAALFPESAEFQVLAHVAGVRPILRRSQPLIGKVSESADSAGWLFNGLGSKGCLYAPRTAAMLVDWLVSGVRCDPDLDFRNFSQL